MSISRGNGIAFREQANPQVSRPNEINVVKTGGALKQSVNGAAYAGIGDNFGSDTIIQLPNSLNALVTALELISTLATTTAGAELSQWLIRMIQSGTVTDWGAFVFRNAGASPAILLGSIANGDGWQIGGAHLLQCVLAGTPMLTLGIGSVSVPVRMEESRASATASATTLTLQANGNLHPITGTTTVNGITTASWGAGSRIFLELASGITITHNSGAPGGGAVAIQLKAGANLTTARITMLPLIYNGTFWYEIG